MLLSKRVCVAGLAVAVVLCIPTNAFAWGPATHVKLASDLLANLGLLPGAVAAIIAAHRRHFIFGNVATDIVFAKKMSKIKQICHRWATGFDLLGAAKTDAGRSFAYGYLSHLAADTVAHNKFLPWQMAVSRSTVSFGHLYWEVRSDARIAMEHRETLADIVRDRYKEPEALLERHLRSTMLSFRTNRALFKRVNLLAAEHAWQRSVDYWSRMSRHALDEAVLREYHEESVGRLVDVLSKGKASDVLNDDPNGNASFACAKIRQKQLRKLRRARIPHGHVIREAAAGHAPVPNRALTLAVD